MIIIIGREDNTDQPRLQCVADGREFFIGKPGSVPQTVSRKHCQLNVEGETITITNLKPNNPIYVDDIEATQNQAISVYSKVQMGQQKFTIPVKSIVEMATGTHSNNLVITIGREEGVRRLCIAVNDGKPPRFMGPAGSVPLSVSHVHCRLILSEITKSKIGKIEVENVKPTNVTYVNGSQVFKMQIDESSHLELGYDKFPLAVKDVFEFLGLSKVAAGPQSGSDGGKQEVPTFSLKPLEEVWQEYESRVAAIQKAQAKFQAKQRIQGLLSMCGMFVYFIGGSELLPIRIGVTALAFLVGIYFIWKSMSKAPIQQQINALQKEYLTKYKCPNPKCGRPFGTRSYDMVKWDRKCSYCGCNYTN